MIEAPDTDPRIWEWFAYGIYAVAIFKGLLDWAPWL